MSEWPINSWMSRRSAPILLTHFADAVRRVVEARRSLPAKSRALRAVRKHLEALLLGILQKNLAEAEEVDPGLFSRTYAREIEALRKAPPWPTSSRISSCRNDFRSIAPPEVP